MKLIQAALAVCGMFEISREERNGLLCDVTCEGIQRWVTEIGEPCMHIEASRTCSAAISLFVILIAHAAHGMRGRPHSGGCFVQYDPHHAQQASRDGLCTFVPPLFQCNA